MKNFLVRCLTVAALSLAGEPVLAQSSEPITVVSPSSAGGLGDTIVRLVAAELTKNDMRMVIDIKAGGAGTIAAEAVLAAPADGRTLLLANISSNVITPLLMKVNYDPVADFKPVILFGKMPTYLIVAPNVPVKSVAELVDYAKANPNTVSYASQGPGSTGHMVAEQFKDVTGLTDIAHVAYRGGGPALQDVMAGNVQMFFDLLAVSKEQSLAGLVRPLAIAATERTPIFPDLPTFTELGYPTLESGSWFGLAASKDTPDEVVTRVNEAVNKILSTPELRKLMEDSGWTVLGGTPAEFASFMAGERVRWAEVIKKAKITVQ